MEWCSPSSIVLTPPIGECSAYAVVLVTHGLAFIMGLGAFIASARQLRKQASPRPSLARFCALCIPLLAWGLWMALTSLTRQQSVVRLLCGCLVTITWVWAGIVSALTREWSSQGLCLMRTTMATGAFVSLLLLVPFDVMRAVQEGKESASLVMNALALVVTGLQASCAWRMAKRAAARARGEHHHHGGLYEQEQERSVRRKRKQQQQQHMKSGGASVNAAEGYEPLLDVIDGDLVVGEGGEVDDDEEDEGRCGPEGRAGLMSRLTFWWIMPLLRKGYQTRSLQQEDLMPLEGRDQASRSHTIFRGHWEVMRRQQASSSRGRGGGSREMTKVKKHGGGWRIARVLLSANFDTFFACGGVLLLSTVVALSIPLVLNTLLAYVEGGDRSGGSWRGYALAGGLFALVILQSLTEHQFWIIGVRCCMRSQTALMGECFRKAIRLNPDGRRTYTTGDLINLMSVDACRIADTNIVPLLHWGTWSSCLIMTVSLLALYQLLGLSAFVGIGIVLVFWPLGYMLGRHGKRASMAIQVERDHRAKLMAQAIESIRLIKSLQWEGFAEQVMQAARAREIVAQVKRQSCFGGNGILASVAMVMGPLAAFACRILLEHRPLTASTAFTSLAWFNILKRPLQLFPDALTSFLDCLVSWERLEALFSTQEVNDRHHQHHATSPSSSSVSSIKTRQQHQQVVVGNMMRSPWAIDISNCTFAWSSDGPAVLPHLDLRIYEGEMVVVVGPVGCGKSTLLHSLIGDCSEQSGEGKCAVNGRVSFVGQSPWIQNATIADNVTFGMPYDRGAFQETIKRCGLRFDLAALSSRGGEQMECGEGGVALSGGQKQRIAVARAVYSQADIILLDDVLSSLDVTVGRRIWDDCLVSYLQSKTRVIVTHQTHFLHHPAVDRIVVMAGDGRIRAMGSYQELLTSTDKAVVETLLGTVKKAASSPSGGGSDAATASSSSSSPSSSSSFGELVGGAAKQKGGHSVVGQVVDEESKEPWRGGGREEEEEAAVGGYSTLLAAAPRGSGDGEEEEGGMVEIATPVAFVDKEDRKSGKIDGKLLMMYLRRFGGGGGAKAGGGLWLGIIVLALFVMEQAVSVFQWFWLSRLTKTTEGQEPKAKGLLVVGGSLLLVTTLRIVLLIYGAITAGNSLHTSVLLSLLRAPMRFFDRQVSGRILNRFIADQASIDSVVPTTLANFFQQLLYFGGTIAVLCYALPEMLPVVLLLAVPYHLISQFYRWPARDLRRLESVSKSPVNSHFAETVRGLSVIRAFGAEDRFVREHLHLSNKSIQCYWTKWIANQWVTIWLEMVGTVLMLLCGLLTVWTTSLEAPRLVHDSVDAGKMGLLMSYAVLVPWSLGWLLKVYFQAEIEFIAVERVSQYIAIPPEDKQQQQQQQHLLAAAAEGHHQVNDGHEEGEKPRQLVDIYVPSSSSSPSTTSGNLLLPASASVMARDVSMRYDVDGEMTLRQCSFSIPSGGQKVAIVGRTAAGKSSVFQLLLGFYEREEGGLLKVAGMDVGSVPVAMLRQRVRLVPQTPTLFGLTIRDALTGHLTPPANHHQDEEEERGLWCVLSRVQLCDAIRGLPSGLDTPLTSIEFSAGERQLLCIARALLHPAPVLLCDEVTSSIDLKTDAKVHAILMSLDATVLVICHRLHHIQDFDRVLVMEHGAVVEEGPPSELLKDANGVLSFMMRNALGARSH